MRHFLIMFEELPIDKTSVKAGENSYEVVTACRCINVGLFISGDLRRDVVISLAIGPLHDLQIISFPGNALKRVSPDERSISFFLLKALALSDKLTMNTLESMDNGIIIHRTDFNNFLELHESRIIVAVPDEQKMDVLDNRYTDVLLIYDTREVSILIESNSLKDYMTLPHPTHPEKFILDVNRSNESGRDDT